MAASIDIEIIKNKFEIGDLRDIRLRGIKAVANGNDAV